MTPISHIILICDAKRGLIMHSQAVNGTNTLKIDREFHNELAASSHLSGSSPPGRTSNKSGPTSAVESPDYHEQDKMRFIRMLSKEFVDYAKTHADAAIIMVAPPRSLALLRQATEVDFKTRTTMEIDKDITKNTMDDIKLFINKIIKN